jgi:Cof subfamily protein (haloacid dehalogenase superfamily)
MEKREEISIPIKALFFDIDGTILNSKGIMSQNVFYSLSECIKRGYLVSVATARSGRIVFRDYEIPGDKSILLERGIFYNGGTIYDKPHNFYQHITIPGHIVNSIVLFIDDYNLHLQIVLQHDDLYHSFKLKMEDKELVNWGFNGNEIHSFDESRINPTTKMMIFYDREWHSKKTDLSDLYEKIIRVFSDTVNIILADSRKCIYILAKKATKGNAINRMISLYKIKPEEVVVFGDDTPDIGMFGMFGHSIAMGNAHDSLKSAASYVTLKNDEDGVVYALINHLKIL